MAGSASCSLCSSSWPSSSWRESLCSSLRDRPLLADDPVGSRALEWSAEGGVSPQDLAEVRFAVALRGYRMEEVDRVLDDTREALAARDERIADLQDVVAAIGGMPPGPGATGPAPRHGGRGRPGGAP